MNDDVRNAVIATVYAMCGLVMLALASITSRWSAVHGTVTAVVGMLDLFLAAVFALRVWDAEKSR